MEIHGRAISWMDMEMVYLELSRSTFKLLSLVFFVLGPLVLTWNSKFQIYNVR